MNEDQQSTTTTEGPPKFVLMDVSPFMREAIAAAMQATETTTLETDMPSASAILSAAEEAATVEFLACLDDLAVAFSEEEYDAAARVAKTAWRNARAATTARLDAAWEAKHSIEPEPAP